MIKKFIIIITLISLSLSCLVTNCPRGGKRGNSVATLRSIVRECPSCGPDKQGQCFGPRICCGSNIGCFVGTMETYSCRKESLFSGPCIAGYAMCRGNKGRCATNGICCTQESCYMDATCRINNDIENDQIGSESGTFFSNPLNEYSH